MATELVTFKLEKKFLQEVDEVARRGGYHTRTEFIRNALREKLDQATLRKSMEEIVHLRGASKRKTTDEELHTIRERVFEEMKRELR